MRRRTVLARLRRSAATIITLAAMLFSNAPLPAFAAASITVSSQGLPNANFPGSPVPASSPAIGIMKITVTPTSTSTLTSVTVQFSGTGFANSDLASITTGSSSGVALYDDTGSGNTGTFVSASDAVVTLAASPAFTSSTSNITLTPATPVALTSGVPAIFWVAIKTSGTIADQDVIAATLPAAGVTTSDGNGPSAHFVMNSLRADTAPAQISSVEGFAGSATVMVHFNKPVQKVGGGNLAVGDSPFTYVDGGGSAQTVSAIAHNAGQDFAMLTMSGNLDAGDVDGTPATLAAGSNKIADMGGNVIGTSAVNMASPLGIDTSTIPTAIVATVYDSTTPLVTLSAKGGVSPYTFAPAAAADITMLTNAGLTLNSNGKLTGTVANTPGSFPVNLKVTDSTSGTPLTSQRFFTLNVGSSATSIPGITNVTPSGGAQSATGLAVSVTGTNTSFSSSSTVQFLLNGSNDTNITVTGISAASATSLNFTVAVAGGAATGNRDVKVTTGGQNVIMPNGFTVFGGGGSGLNLLLPTASATNIAMPPGFSFSPSSSSTVNSYRITLKSTSDFSGSTLWDYTFPKPADGQNSNGSHCSSTQCNLTYGAGAFRILTQPSPLAPNTTYYWQVRTYAETTINVSDSAAPAEFTAVRGFTTVSSVNDVTPPQIMHRPVFQATESANLDLFARVVDNVATTATTPALTTKIFYCAGSGCTPTTEGAAPTAVGNGYFKYRIPSATISTAGTIVRYYIQASDGTTTINFKQPDGTTPFQLTSAAAGASTIAGTVKDSTGTCSTAVRQATVFAEGTGFSTTSSNDANCTYTISGLTAGTYDVVAVKDGFADRFISGIPAGATGINFQLSQGGGGGFGGDSTKPRIKFNGPMDGMTNIPGNDTNFKIFVAFDKSMSQTSVTTAGNMTVNDLNVQTGALTNITTTKGAWTYYSTAPSTPGLPPEANMAVWSFTGGNIFGDGKTIAVVVTPNVTDTAGNSVQGNQSDGSYTFTFSTGSTANFSGFNTTTGNFSGGGTFGTAQFVPPHVVGSTPAPGTSNVPTNAKVVLNFSEPMADDGGGYLLKSNVKLFTVSGTAETDVSTAAISSVSLDTGKQIATVALNGSFNSGAFPVSTKIRVKVLGGAKAATAITMAPPGQATNVMFMTEFTTGTAADTAAPTMLGIFPDNAATGVPVNVGAVNVSFSKDMDASTITSSTMTLSVGSTTVSGTVEYRPTERQAFFVPKSALTPNTTYTFALSTGVKGLNGQAIAAVSRTFTTGAADTIAPTIAFVDADDYNLAVTLSEPMNAAKATDSLNFAASVLKSGNFALRYGAAGFSASAGDVITIPPSANFSYDQTTNTLSIGGYRDPASLLVSDLLGKEILVTVTGVKDLSGNAISTSGGANTGRAPIKSSATTKGALGPSGSTDASFNAIGTFIPTNFDSATFGFAPPVEVRPFNFLAGITTIYGVRIPISKQIPASGQVVLTFPSGFDVSGAKQDVNSPMRKDLNGPGSGTITFACQTATGGTSCGGGATVTGDAGGDTASKGGLADDGVIVNTSSRTVTVTVSAATNSTGSDTHDFLTIDIAGIKNSTVPKDFNTTGYSVDVKTKKADGATLLESMTSQPFFIQSAGTSTLSGTITAASASTGTMKIYVGSPLTGPVDVTSGTFAAGSGTYSIPNLPNGEYFLFTDQSITLGANDYVGKANPEHVVVSGNTTYNFTIAAATGGTSFTVNVDGPSAEPLDIFAGSPTGFRVKQVTLDSSAGAEAFTINLPDGNWFLGVGPQMPKGPNVGPPPTPAYLPPKPKEVRITNPTCAVDGMAGCAATFTLTTSNKQIKGTVKDGSGKVIANAEVYGYSPKGGFGTHTTSDSAGAFTMNVVAGTFVVGAFVPGMPPSRETPVSVTTAATNYLLIDGAATAISPATAATTFILKVAKPDYTISGKVTDGTTTVQGASVYAYRTDGPGHGNALTDSSGNYTLYVTAGTWKVGTFLPQYGNLSEQTVTVTTASQANVNFAPTSTGTFYTVSGRVYQDTNSSSGYNSGEEISGAFVRISGNGTSNEAITSVDGTYTVKVPAGNGYLVRAFAPSIGELPPLASFNVSADTASKDILVPVLRTITFTMSSSVTKALVELFSTTGIGARAEIINATTGTLTVSNGSYTVRVNMQGTAIPLTAIAATSGSTVFSNTTGLVTVDGNEGLTVTVPTLRTVSGTVTDGSVAVADAWVEISNPAAGVFFGTKSASDGTFSVQVAGSTTYGINALKPGYVREPSTVIVAAANITGQTLAMTAASRSIAGQVLIGSSGAANAFIRAERQGGGFAGTQADANGTYTLPVSPGVWKVFAVADGYAETALTSNPVDVTTASATGKNITVSTTVTLAAPKTKPITPASGGTVEDTTAGVKLTIPANALGSSTSAGSVQTKETNNVHETDSAQPLMNATSTGSYVESAQEIKATDSEGTPVNSLNDSVTVEMTYTLAELAATPSSGDSSINTKDEADDIQMAYWDETTANWVTSATTTTYKDSTGNVITDATTIDTAAEFVATVATITLATTTDHFSLYAPVVPTDASAPAAPTGLSGSSSTNSSISLTWTAVSGATGYDIYRSTSSGGTFTRRDSEPTIGSGSTTSYSDSSLSGGTTYYYKVTAINASGESAATSEVAVATLAANGGGGGGGATESPTVSVIAPNTIATYAAGSTVAIRWQAGGSGISTIRIKLSTDGGATYPTLVAQNESNDGTYAWIVPSTATAKARIRVEALNSSVAVVAADSSDVDFNIGSGASAAADATATGVFRATVAINNNPTINDDKALAVIDAMLAKCTAGDLVKASGPSVYYCGSDGKRYVFVNDKAYFTWYKDFKAVKTISDSALASITIGGNVTYRPGVRMIKIQSDPRVYAVSRGGLLRWVSTENAARTLYGADWNKKIDDVTDSFFVNYHIGADITDADVDANTVPPVESASSTAASACSTTTTFTSLLSVGSDDSQVLPLQKLLQCLGHFSASTVLTGHFGSLTMTAVKAFQSSKRLSQSGSTDASTRTALNTYKK